jgi:membrane protein YqaA with SNARE-associated domain
MEPVLTSTKVQTEPENDTQSKRKQLFVLIAAVLITLALCYVALRYHHHLEKLGKYGIAGLFTLSLLNNATFMIPVPFATVFGCTVSPQYGVLIIGFVMGLGGAIGEITGYMAGYGGSGMLPNNNTAQKIEKWVRRHGMAAIIVLALIPNPFFDIGGVVAGMMRMGWHKFVLAAWVGKGARMALMALACTGALPALMRFFTP